MGSETSNHLKTMDPTLKPKILKRVRGFPDQLPEESAQKEALLSTIIQVLKNFDFQKVHPPILELSDLFTRSLGENSDIVHKEMYSLQKGEESLTLRPEGTVSIARMFITHKMRDSLPLRWYYHGPMFRHERPQKGRFRQFHQVGVEFLGDPSIQADAEILSLSWVLVQKLALKGKTFLEINSLGSLKEREQYKKQLKAFLSPFQKQLSPESQTRLKQNPLRILDSKDPADQNLIKKAPLLRDSLGPASREKYENIKKLLAELNIPFKENTGLVRGLDYYNDLVFEWTSPELGAQSTFLAGGRYDSLIESLAGPPTPALGWALGLERLQILSRSFPVEPMQIGLLSSGEKAEKKAFQIAYKLRAEGWSVHFRFSGNFSKQMKRMSKKCLFALIYGEREHNKEEIILKDLLKKQQISFPLSQLKEELQKKILKQPELK